jgi:dTDP-4-dehydrorhamnose reductase
MKILVTGKDGQVGWELQRVLAPLGELTAVGRADLDLADADQIVSLLRSVKPDIIVNAAAYTAVDRAESERNLAFSINARAPETLAVEAKRLDALLIHYSTDYVFDGSKTGAYLETDPTHPINVYGESKLAGERAIQESGARYLTFRTSWVYAGRGKNFLLTVLRLARERDELRIVADQVGSPTSAAAIAEATSSVLRQLDCETGAGPFETGGVYHMTAGGTTSWFGFAEAIRNLAGFPTPIWPIPSAEYPTPAARPANSQLDNGKLWRDFQIRLPHWDIALQHCLRTLQLS